MWDQNHPTNNVAWDVRAARFGLTINKVSTPRNPASTAELVDSFTSQFNSRTSVLALTHVSNLSGIKLPIAELVTAAHARGIYVHVDGAQVWGAMDLDLKSLDVDS
ncbi:MAG TPA: aminotransferase class V-fold PLP-dependent enzyme, partial [Gammaproteobacteria bacterium]|nr:aminotransferase class V-fold PLP-dependent enzyme [Gammaproteobacteria bacterium]